MIRNVLATVRKARLCPLAAFLFILLCTTSAKAGTTITQSTCPVLIAQAGDYSLGTDVGPCMPGVDGIDIVASAVTLHLNGHTINGSADPGTCNNSQGIHVGLPSPAPMLSLVHVLGDGTINNFQSGFLAENSAGSFVKFVTVTADCGNLFGFMSSFGFTIAGGGQWKLQGNVVRETQTRSSGIVLSGTDDNDLVRNDINVTVTGMLLEFSNNNTVVNNISNQGGGSGLVLSSSNNNEIHANATNNNSVGISIDVGSSVNNITGNSSFNNSIFDMFDGNPNCDSNKWEGNKFNTANQPCIH